MKLPKMKPTKWSSASYNFYSFISGCSRLFNQTDSRYDYSAKIQLIHQYMPADKQSEFHHIDDWQKFKNL